MEHLDRHVPAQPPIVRLPHRGETTLTDGLDQLEAPVRQELARVQLRPTTQMTPHVENPAVELTRVVIRGVFVFRSRARGASRIP